MGAGSSRSPAALALKDLVKRVNPLHTKAIDEVGPYGEFLQIRKIEDLPTEL